MVHFSSFLVTLCTCLSSFYLYRHWCSHSFSPGIFNPSVFTHSFVFFTKSPPPPLAGWISFHPFFEYFFCMLPNTQCPLYSPPPSHLSTTNIPLVFCLLINQWFPVGKFMRLIISVHGWVDLLKWGPCPLTKMRLRPQNTDVWPHKTFKPDHLTCTGLNSQKDREKERGGGEE